MTSRRSKPLNLENLPDWMKLIPPSPLSFPTFQNLVREDKILQTRTPSPKRSPGLFETYLGGDVKRLLADFNAYPEKYEPGLGELLQELLAGRGAAELNPDEQNLLNRAVIDFMGAPPAKPKPQPVRQVEQKDERPAEGPRPGVDVPTDLEMPAYWWL